jgi:hypothetical protein
MKAGLSTAEQAADLVAKIAERKEGNVALA